MATSDKYPGSSGRRRFVKGVVGSAALASVGVGSAAAIDTATTTPSGGGGVTKYVGIENTQGPAPRGMPLIPVDLDSEGHLKGVWPATVTKTVDGREVTVAETEIGGMTYSSTWFQYCGVQTYPGIRPDADQNEYLRSASDPPYDWQAEAKATGDRLHVDDFADFETWGNDIGRSGVGKPAMARWRSEGVDPLDTIPVQVIRSRRIEELRDDPPGGIDADAFRGFTTEEGFVAWLDKCTHFCCAPRFKSYADSRGFDAEDEVFCNCHQSVYDPFSPVVETFFALPRP